MGSVGSYGYAMYVDQGGEEELQVSCQKNLSTRWAINPMKLLKVSSAPIFSVTLSLHS